MLCFHTCGVHQDDLAEIMAGTYREAPSSMPRQGHGYTASCPISSLSMSMTYLLTPTLPTQQQPNHIIDMWRISAMSYMLNKPASKPIGRTNLYAIECATARGNIVCCGYCTTYQVTFDRREGLLPHLATGKVRTCSQS